MYFYPVCTFFYEELFKKILVTCHTLKVWIYNSCLLVFLSKFEEPFSIEEIEKALDDLEGEKMLGPNGFPMKFY